MRIKKRHVWILALSLSMLHAQAGQAPEKVRTGHRKAFYEMLETGEMVFRNPYWNSPERTIDRMDLLERRKLTVSEIESIAVKRHYASLLACALSKVSSKPDEDCYRAITRREDAYEMATSKRYTERRERRLRAYADGNHPVFATRRGPTKAYQLIMKMRDWRPPGVAKDTPAWPVWWTSLTGS